MLLDPGQGLPDFTAMQTRELIAAARFLIVNAHEWQVLQQQLRSSPAEIASGLEWVIVTLGAQGAELWQGAQRRHFGAIPVAEVREHTGAGDAFRAGLIAALAYGQDIDVALRAAALSAHFKLGSPGTQQHRFTPAEFVSAWQHAYSEACPFSAALV